MIFGIDIFENKKFYNLMFFILIDLLFNKKNYNTDIKINLVESYLDNIEKKIN